MFRNLINRPGLTQAEHRALPALSASDLLKWNKARRGIADSIPDWAAFYGSCFHTALLEPHRWHLDNEPTSAQQERNRAEALHLANGLRQRADVADLLREGAVEQTYTAIHAATGLEVKGRADLLTTWPTGWVRRVYDAKTTSCQSEDAFRASIIKYGYEVQAALYADLLGADGFTWIAVSKKTGDVWNVELTPEMWLSGRGQYTELLTCYAEVQERESQLEAAAWADSLPA